jgi:hypothetical protein
VRQDHARMGEIEQPCEYSPPAGHAPAGVVGPVSRLGCGIACGCWPCEEATSGLTPPHMRPGCCDRPTPPGPVRVRRRTGDRLVALGYWQYPALGQSGESGGSAAHSNRPYRGADGKLRGRAGAEPRWELREPTAQRRLVLLGNPWIGNNAEQRTGRGSHKLLNRRVDT